MSIQLIVIAVLFGAFLALIAKALYHRNRAHKLLDLLDAEMPSLRASVGLTSRFERAKKGRRFSSN